MKQSHAANYQALSSRDARFDGVFFVGVTSTGIYCRPICPVKTPKSANCLFFDSAAAAEKENFRPCLRCRPELAPGSAPVDDANRIAQLIAQRIEEGLNGAGLEDIASQFELCSRQIRRIVQNEMGVSPIEYIQTRRLLLAKQLLTETRLPMVDIAYASGFASLRRFNDTFRARYKMPPTRIRKQASETPHNATSESSCVLLTYRPPYDWQGILEFLRNRLLIGTEHISNDSYCRTVRLGKHKGWVELSHMPHKNALRVRFSHSLTPILPALLGRLRNLFDLGARPDLINAVLKRDKFLKPLIAKNPGLRVPGSFDGFEQALRAILGQQITVKAATTLACRFVESFGEKIATPYAELNRLAPTTERIASCKYASISKLGIIASRANSIIQLAKAMQSGELRLEPGANPETSIAQLIAMPGLGPWTAHYICMRALRWPDAFPKEDIAIRNNLGGVTAKQAEQLSQAWRPWRSYAVLHVWGDGSGKKD